MLIRNGVLCSIALVSGMTIGSPAFAQRGESDTEQSRATSTTESTNHGQNVSIEKAILAKLRKGNDSEIALGQLAQQRSKNEDIRSIAEHMIRDHQKMNQQLEQLAMDQSGNETGANATDASTRGVGAADKVPSRTGDKIEGTNRTDPSSGTRGDAVAGSGRGGAGAASGGTSQSSTGSVPSASGSAGAGSSGGAGEETGPQASGSATADTGSKGRTAYDSATLRNNESASGTVPVAFWRVIEQTCENELAMTKDALSNLDGDDFNMAYLAQQKVAHMHTLAELTAIEKAGPARLRQTAATTKTKVTEHLTHIKQTMDKMKGGEKASDRSSKSDVDQR